MESYGFFLHSLLHIGFSEKPGTEFNTVVKRIVFDLLFSVTKVKNFFIVIH
jgi:hypothetical protein